MTIFPNFGPEFKSEFQMDAKLRHFNNGSYGTVPRAVRASRLEWIDKFELHPDRYLKRELDADLESVLEPISKYVHAKTEDLVFIVNATQGMSIVLRSYDWNQGDLILCFSTNYITVRILLDFLVKKHGVELVMIDHKPCSNEELISQVQKKIDEVEKQGKKIKMSVVDAISSMPSLIIPYEEISKILKEHGSLVVIDGAQAFGQIPLQIGSTHADFFFTNLHKWGYSYRPTSVLFAKPEVQSKIFLPVITYGCGSGDYKGSFAWPGTMDFSPWLSAKAALEFRFKVGDKKIMDYIHELAWNGGHLVAKYLGTSVLGEEYQMAAMANVCLPVSNSNEDFGSKLEDHLYHNYTMQIKTYYYQDKWWIRISAQIYLGLEDFEKLAEALKKSIPEVQKQFKGAE